MDESAGNVAFLLDRYSGTQFSLSRLRTVIGREPDNDMVFAEDRTISRKHAQIIALDDIFLLKDLKSRNGTFLNGVKVTRCIELNSGDEITLGRRRMIFHLAESKIPESFVPPQSSAPPTEALNL